MQTLDAALATLVRSNQITRDEAIKRCHHPEEFARLFENGGGAPTPGKSLYQRPEVIRLQRRLDPAAAMATNSAPAAAVPGMPPMQAPAAMAAPAPVEHAPAPTAPMQSEFNLPPVIDGAMAPPAAAPPQQWAPDPAAAAPPPMMEFAPPVGMPPAAPLQPGQMPDLPGGMPGQQAAPPQQQWPVDPATGMPYAPPGEVA
jgi:hypothetical protein